MVAIATNAASASSNGAGSMTFWRSTSIWNNSPATAQIAAMIHGRSGHGGSLSSRRAETRDDLAGESGAAGALVSVMRLSLSRNFLILNLFQSLPQTRSGDPWLEAASYDRGCWNEFSMTSYL